MTPTKDQQAQEYAEKKMENVYSQEWDSEYVEGLIECAFKDGADFALGKQTETIAQEDIEKAAEAFATPPIGNGGMFTREQVKELLVRFAQLLLSKQEKDAGATEALASQWRSVEVEEPPIGKLILCRDTDRIALAYFDGEAITEAVFPNGDVTMPFWMPIPPIHGTNTEKQ